MKDIINKSLLWENKLQELFRKNKFSIITSHTKGGFALRPDFIIEKNNKKIIVELKVSNIITEKTLFQIMYYRSKIKSDLAYLALPQECIIKKEIKEKLLKNNIGIITIKEDRLIFEEPTSKSKLSSEDLINYDLFSENKNLEEKLNKTQEEFKMIAIELMLYILIGGLLVHAITELLLFYFEKPIYLWVLFIINMMIVIGILYFYKNKINILRRNKK